MWIFAMDMAIIAATGIALLYFESNEPAGQRAGARILGYSMGKKLNSRVTVMLMNSHQHIELVEVRTDVRPGGSVGEEVFEGDLCDTEVKARILLQLEIDRRAGLPGVSAALSAPQADYELVGILAAVTGGISTGKIVWLRQAKMTAGRPTW
jgi:hypothetical protein